MPSYWTPLLPDQRMQLDREWQRALGEAVKHNPDRLIAYLRSDKELTDRHRQELAELLGRRRIRHGVKGRRHGSDPVHDKLYRLRTDIITFTQLGLQELRQEYHGELPYNGIRAVFDPIFEFFIHAYDHDLTAEEVEQLKIACLDELKA
jgi:hypothetical protein